MSNIDKRALRKAAMHAKATDDWGCDADNFHDKATPDAVLALLDELEAKDKQIDDLKATAAHSNAGWKEAHEQEARAEAAEKRIADLEAREVKLTDINEYLAEVHDKTLNKAFRLLAEGVRAGDVAAMRAAGIHVAAAGKGE
ncbi:ead/Ea22-like family protein [Enterobacter roggenkampii]|uniref:ead/Ea22-like family protein n=1 Tax=Enterobacter roggenkampii TaxID=1812935 RepID=UPI001E6213A7|nr:ead/Ea22-like family protein [Enterobacter roggenkampii]MCE1976296.1 ead/Ea22-like family protein [Enterobacter roggenkampii]